MKMKCRHPVAIPVALQQKKVLHRWEIIDIQRDHSFITFTKFFRKLTFLTP